MLLAQLRNSLEVRYGRLVPNERGNVDDSECIADSLACTLQVCRSPRISADDKSDVLQLMDYEELSFKED